MAEAGDEWELSKENVQPLRQGRAMSTLQEVLSQQDSSNHHAIQQQKQMFESELRFYTGDDPLDVWDRYITWAQQTFPQGGKESNLSLLFERAVKTFHLEKHYYDDIRYLNICLKFANFCTEPVDLYAYLYSQGIGIQHAQLYITWAEEYEARGSYKKADSIFQDGVNCRAEPQEKLEAHHKQFQARVSREILQGISHGEDIEDPGASEPQRSSLEDLKTRGKNKARVPVTRVGDSVKSRNQNISAQNVPPPQISGQARFTIFDETSSNFVIGSQNSLTNQPWAALPTSRSKENEQKAGPWILGRPSRGDHPTSSYDASSNLPSFIPYVDEFTEQQTVTPCKINPSFTSVLSARKPGKEEDPLQRLKSISQRKEQVMYCKDKIYAGLEEFSFEEIRAERHMAKLRKQNEEELLASAIRRQAMEKQIAEMEKQLKELSAKKEEHKTIEPAQVEECNIKPKIMKDQSPCEHNTVSNVPSYLNEDAMETVSCTPVPQLQSAKNLSLVQHTPHLTALNRSSMPSFEPFTIYDETLEKQIGIPPQTLSTMPLLHGQPLVAVLKPVYENAPPCADTPDTTEPLNEETIVSGSGRNTTLSVDPEDTCDFVRAAQLASTPFHNTRDESEGSSTSSLERIPLQEKTPGYEESFHQVIDPKKLSPILETSREDVLSSGSFVSTASTNSFDFLARLVQAKTNLVTPVSEVYEQALESSVALYERFDLCRNVLAPMSELMTSEQIHQDGRQMPSLKEDADVQFGSEMYKLKSETFVGKSSRILTGKLIDMGKENMNGVVIKVDSEVVPWDFYIAQQLKMRLDEDYEINFLKPSDCYLFQNGCITIYKDINGFPVQDMLQDPKTVVENVVILLAYNLLSLIEKLHSADIVHGDLRIETLLLDNRIFDLPSCPEMNGFIRLTDFSHSMDLRICPRVTSKAFPIAQTEYGQQVLGNQTSPYQVDLLGIANIIHFMIFAKSLQIHQEDSRWKINREVQRWWRRDLWSAFFSKILNTDKESTAYVLKELKDEMLQLLDSRFQDDLCTYFSVLDLQLNLL